MKVSDVLQTKFDRNLVVLRWLLFGLMFLIFVSQIEEVIFRIGLSFRLFIREILSMETFSAIVPLCFGLLLISRKTARLASYLLSFGLLIITLLVPLFSRFCCVGTINCSTCEIFFSFVVGFLFTAPLSSVFFFLGRLVAANEEISSGSLSIPSYIRLNNASLLFRIVVGLGLVTLGALMMPPIETKIMINCVGGFAIAAGFLMIASEKTAQFGAYLAAIFPLIAVGRVLGMAVLGSSLLDKVATIITSCITAIIFFFLGRVMAAKEELTAKLPKA